MKSKEERRQLHRTSPRIRRTVGGAQTAANQEEIITTSRGIYKQTKIDGQVLYTKLNTEKE